MNQLPEQSDPSIDVALGIVIRHTVRPVELLITKRPAKTVYAGYWELPGGKVHADESPEQAAIRELREELGIIVEPFQSLDVITYRYDHAHVRLHPFYCRHTAGEPRNLEVEAHQWIPLSDLDRYTFPEANEPIFQRICDDYGEAG